MRSPTSKVFPISQVALHPSEEIECVVSSFASENLVELSIFVQMIGLGFWLNS